MATTSVVAVNGAYPASYPGAGRANSGLDRGTGGMTHAGRGYAAGMSVRPEPQDVTDCTTEREENR